MNTKDVVLARGYAWNVYHADLNRDSIVVLPTRNSPLECAEQTLSFGDAPDMSKRRGTLIWCPDPPKPKARRRA